MLTRVLTGPRPTIRLVARSRQADESEIPTSNGDVSTSMAKLGQRGNEWDVVWVTRMSP